MYEHAGQSLDAALRGSRRSAAAPALKRAYSQRRLRRNVLRLVNRAEGGRFYSRTLRELLAAHHGVEVGAYSYGPCLTPGAVPAGVSIGRYVSMAGGVQIFRRNHPLPNLSLHPFFYNPVLGVVPDEVLTSAPLRIEHDVWLGHGAIVLPGCARIGLGAVVGAGSVVTKDVEDFAVVGGNPTRPITRRFPPEVAERVRRSRWWEHAIEEMPVGLFMGEAADLPFSSHPLLMPRGD